MIRFNSIKYVLFILFFAFNGFAQTLINTKLEADFIDVDDLGNIYLVSNAELLKYNKSGALEYRFSDAMLGSISSIDATNPLRIMIFYRESNTLLFLNQQLAIINDAIVLDNFSTAEASLATSSSQGGFWIFDEITLTLVYFDNNKTSQKQSVNLAGYLHQEEPLQLTEQNQLIYLQTTSKVFVLDTYGNLIRTLPLASKYKLKANKNKLYYQNNKQLHCYNTLSLNDSIIEINKNDSLKQAIYNKGKIILLNNKGVAIQAKKQ